MYYKYIPLLLRSLFLKCPVQDFKAHWLDKKLKPCSLSHPLPCLPLWPSPSFLLTPFPSSPSFSSQLSFLLQTPVPSFFSPYPFSSPFLWFFPILSWDFFVTLNYNVTFQSLGFLHSEYYSLALWLLRSRCEENIFSLILGSVLYHSMVWILAESRLSGKYFSEVFSEVSKVRLDILTYLDTN